MFLRGVDLPHLVLRIGTRAEVSFLIKCKSVGPAARLHVNGHFAVDTPFHDAVVRLVREKHVTFFVTRWTFREREIAGDFFHLRPGSDDVAIGS